MLLSDPVDVIPGVGPKTAVAFREKGVQSIEDLLLYLPRRHDDFSHIVDIRHISPGPVSIRAKINNITSRRGRRGMSITEAIASDDSDSVKLVWFNQPYRAASLKTDQQYFISGNYKLNFHHYSIINPSVEICSEVPLNSARIMAIYPENKHLNSAAIRRAVYRILPQAESIVDPMPSYVTASLGLMSYAQAVATIHFPQSIEELNDAKLRLQFNELFPMLLANALTTKELREQHAFRIKFQPDLARQFVAKLPFKLTDDQRRVTWQIYQDMDADMPMNRLVEGDVGSGKTVVAVMAAVMSIAAGYKTAFMAPTELLVKQHAASISKLLEPLGLLDSLILITGSMSARERRMAIDKANSMANTFVLGTHSLLTSGVNWSNLALLIIDEQHRFGVDQRRELQRQARHLPHFLSITATPIPRSLALTVFSDLKLSKLKTMPAKRQPINTVLVAPTDFNRFLDKLRQEINRGRQAYIVGPHIRATDNRDRTAVETIFTELQRKMSPIPVGLIHGQMSAVEQDRIMSDFVDRRLPVLVSTTVIEVGVDVANATLIAIFGPERFGLAQLHQLRGRVGRGEHESSCYLILSDSLEPLPRLQQFARIQDGFELSEIDLHLRGPGAIYGKLQHGKGASAILTLDDQNLLSKAKKGVDLFLKQDDNLLKYKQLSAMVSQAQQLTYLN